MDPVGLVSLPKFDPKRALGMAEMARPDQRMTFEYGWCHGWLIGKWEAGVSYYDVMEVFPGPLMYHFFLLKHVQRSGCRPNFFCWAEFHCNIHKGAVLTQGRSILGFLQNDLTGWPLSFMDWSIQVFCWGFMLSELWKKHKSHWRWGFRNSWGW